MLLQKLVGNLYSVIIEVLLWLIPIAAMATGYFFGYSLLNIPPYLGLIAGAIGGLLLDVIMFGPIIILLNVRSSLKNIENK